MCARGMSRLFPAASFFALPSLTSSFHHFCLYHFVRCHFAGFRPAFLDFAVFIPHLFTTSLLITKRPRPRRRLAIAFAPRAATRHAHTELVHDDLSRVGSNSMRGLDASSMPVSVCWEGWESLPHNLTSSTSHHKATEDIAGSSTRLSTGRYDGYVAVVMFLRLCRSTLTPRPHH